MRHYYFLLVSLGMIIHPVTAAAQYGHSDMRTSTPETIMAERKQWGADFAYGGSFNGGNIEENEQSGSFSVFKNYGRSTVYLNGSLIYHTIDNVQQNNQGNLTVRYDHPIGGNWKIFAINTNAYNKFLDLNYRTATGGGPWYDLSLGDTKHGISLSVMYEYESFRKDIVEHTERLSFRDVSQIPVSNTAEIVSDMYYAPKIDEFADYHFFEELSLESLIWKDTLGLKISWSYDYDSRPKPGIKPYDVIAETAFTLHFGK